MSNSLLDGLSPPDALEVGAVSGTDIASGTVTKAHMANAAISGAILESGAVLRAHMGNAAISGAILQSGAVLRAHMGNAAISGAILESGAVLRAHMGNAAISGAILESGAVLKSHIGNDALSGAMFEAISIPTGKLAAGAVVNADLGTAAASGTKVSQEFLIGFIGSPVTTSNVIIVAGSGATGAGSDAWVPFNGFTFAEAPHQVQVTPHTSIGGMRVAPGSIAVGSFYVLSENASEEFSWLAIGSGRTAIA